MLDRLQTFIYTTPETAHWISADNVDPGVSTNWGFFPFMPTLKEFSGGIIAGALVLCVVAIIGSVVMLAFGKSMKSQSMSSVSSGALLWTIFASVIIGSSSGLVAWAAGIDIGF